MLNLARCSLCSALLSAAVNAAPPAAMRLWVVAPAAGQGVDFTSIQAAVNAASDGDTILVRAGTYLGFTIDGKALTVVGEASAAIESAGFETIALQNLGAAQSAVIRNLGGRVSVRIGACAGPVTLEALRARLGTYAVDNSAAVTLLGCEFQAMQGAALESTNANVCAFGSAFLGVSTPFPSAPGAVGARVIGGRLIAENCRFAGGTGGQAQVQGLFCFAPPGNGGDGLQVQAAAVVELYGCSATAGSPGSERAPCPPASFGVAIRGTVSVTGSASQTAIQTPALLPTSQAATFVLTAPPQSFAWLALGTAQNPLLGTPCSRTFYVDLANFALVLLGQVPGSGSLPLPIPALGGLATDAATLFVQPGTVTLTECRAGQPSAVVLLR